MSETTDSICGFPTYKPYCLGCKAPLLLENAWMSEGCPCNSKPGCNTINGTRWRLLRDLQQQQSDDLATLRAQVAQLTLELTGCRELIARIAEAQRPHCTTECIEGVWWAKCKSGGVYGPHSTEREALLEVAEGEQEIARLREVISQTWEECDDARMSEVEDARKEADHWKSEGDMYGWNFHQGRSYGMIAASIIYHRIKRAALLTEASDGA